VVADPAPPQGAFGILTRNSEEAPLSQPDRLTPEKEAEIEELSRQLQEFEGDYHYPHRLLANGSHALLKLLEECRALRAERDEYRVAAAHCEMALFSERDRRERAEADLSHLKGNG
jgi:chromosome segregation ATPase